MSKEAVPDSRSKKDPNMTDLKPVTPVTSTAPSTSTPAQNAKPEIIAGKIDPAAAKVDAKAEPAVAAKM